MNTIFLITGDEMHFEKRFMAIEPERLVPVPSGPFAEKQQTLTCVARSPFVAAVSFIPMDPSLPQLLFARRGEEEDQTGFVPPRSFYKGEFASDIILIHRQNLVAATRGVEAQSIGQVREILDHFLKDRQTRAIALTFEHVKQQYTRIWAKWL